MSTLNCVSPAALHPPPAVQAVEVQQRAKYRERPAIYVADAAYAETSAAPPVARGATGVERSPSLPHFPARFPVKKAQHGGRFDAVDFVPTTSSPKGKNRTRRSQQTLQDLTAMNTNDHAQRSMQRQGSIVLLQGTETKDGIAGRPVFTDNSAFSSPLASAIYMSSPYAAAKHTTSSHTPSSPRDAISPLSPPPVANLPQRPHTAHPSSSSSRSRVALRPLAVDVGDLASAVLSLSTGATAVPQPPDVGHATDSSPSRTHSQLPSQQGAASPLSSSRSKRPSSALPLSARGGNREQYQLATQNVNAASCLDLSLLSHSSPRVLPPNKVHATPALSVPSSFNQSYDDNLARFENIVPPWSAGRSQRPLSAKSSSSKLSPSSTHRDSSCNVDVEFAHMRSVAADALSIPLWKFEQQGMSAITDTAFRMNYGKVLKSPRSQHIAPAQMSGVMPLPVQSSNTQGASLTGPVTPGRGIDIYKSKTVSPDGVAVSVYRIGEPRITSEDTGGIGSTGKVYEAVVRSADDDAMSVRGSSPRIRVPFAAGRVVHVELPFGGGASASGRAVATAVQVPIGSPHWTDSHPLESPTYTAAFDLASGHFERRRGLSDAVLNTALIYEARKANFNELRASGRASPPLNKSPRPEWRQKYRMASDTIQLSPHSPQISNLNFGPSSPASASSNQHVLQPLASPALYQAPILAMVKGQALKSNMQGSKGSVDAISIVVPAPPQAGQG